MTDITIEDGVVHFDVAGIEHAPKHRGNLDIPIQHIVGAKVDPGALHRWAGLRLPGTAVPGVLKAGAYISKGNTTFWDVHKGGQSISVVLRNEDFAELIVDVADPDGAVAMLNHVLRGV